MRSALLLVSLVACGGASHVPAGPEPVRSTSPADPTCPLEVPGTSIAVEDTAAGAALVFVTTGDVDGVRARATALGDAHDHRGNVHGDMAAMFSTPATTSVAPIPGGARVTFTPTSPADLAAMQGELHMHAGHLAATSCRMAM